MNRKLYFIFWLFESFMPLLAQQVYITGGGSGVIIISDTTSSSQAGKIYYNQSDGNYYAGRSDGHYTILVNPPTKDLTNDAVAQWSVSENRWIDGAATIRTEWYGVSWDCKNDTYTRLGTLADSAASATIPDALLPIQARMRRCVLANDGTVLYYLKADDSNYKANGQLANIDTTGGLADGQVMVEIPNFWYYHHWDPIDSVHTWKISQDSIAGFRRAFQYDYVYIGAYEGTIYDVSDGVYKGDANNIADTVNDTLCSVSGIKPHSSETRAEYRALAENRGSGWHQLDNRILYAVQILYLVEYADFNSQSKISDGNTKFASWDYTADIGPTGQSNSLGNFSGGQATAGGDSLDFASYRGIENLWGSLWEFLDGVNVNNDGSSSKLYLADDYAVYADNTTTGYTLYGNLAEADGYSKGILDIATGIYPNAVGGSSTTYLCDYYYTYYDNDQNSGWRVVLVSGTAPNGAGAGLIYVNANYGSPDAGSLIAGRLCYH